MPKVGLKETLSLLAAGYKKKDIEALAAVDEEQEQVEISKHENQEKEILVEEKKDEPDYKVMYEELLEKNKQTEAKVTKLQQENVHRDMAPAAAEERQKAQESLLDTVRSYM